MKYMTYCVNKEVTDYDENLSKGLESCLIRCNAYPSAFKYAKILLEYGAPNCKDKLSNYSYLLKSIYNQNKQLFLYLLRLGCETNISNPTQSDFALNIATYLSHPKFWIKNLLLHGSNPLILNYKLQTPLHTLIKSLFINLENASDESQESIFNDVMDSIKLVLESEKIFRKKYHQHNSHKTCSSNFICLTPLVNAMDADNLTPLLNLKKNLNPKYIKKIVAIAELLLDNNACPNIPDGYNRTLLSYSIVCLDDCYELTRLLINYGSNIYSSILMHLPFSSSFDLESSCYTASCLCDFKTLQDLQIYCTCFEEMSFKRSQCKNNCNSRSRVQGRVESSSLPKSHSFHPKFTLKPYSHVNCFRDRKNIQNNIICRHCNLKSKSESDEYASSISPFLMEILENGFEVNTNSFDETNTSSNTFSFQQHKGGVLDYSTSTKAHHHEKMNNMIENCNFLSLLVDGDVCSFDWFFRSIIARRSLENSQKSLRLLAMAMSCEPYRMKLHVYKCMFRNISFFRSLAPLFIFIKEHLQEFWTQPTSSLQSLSLRCIRKNCSSHNFPALIQAWDIPDTLKDALLFQD